VGDIISGIGLGLHGPG